MLTKRARVDPVDDWSLPHREKFPDPYLNNGRRLRVKACMKSTNLTGLAVALAATLVLVSSALAAPSEAELMKQAKITKTQAGKIALAKVPHGKIQSAEIENEHHALVWSFDIAKPGAKDITEVLVNAKTGKIVEISTETPKAQAKEHAEDKKAAGN